MGPIIPLVLTIAAGVAATTGSVLLGGDASRRAQSELKKLDDLIDPPSQGQAEGIDFFVTLNNNGTPPTGE